MGAAPHVHPHSPERLLTSATQSGGASAQPFTIVQLAIDQGAHVPIGPRPKLDLHPTALTAAPSFAPRGGGRVEISTSPRLNAGT